MKSFKLMMLLAALVLFTSFYGNAYSQRNSTPGDRAGKRADRLYKSMNLTDDQYNRVYQSLLTYETQYDTDMSKYGMNTDGWNSAYKTNTDKLNTSMQGILTPDQMTYYNNYDSNIRSGIKYNGSTNTTRNGNTNNGNMNNGKTNSNNMNTKNSDKTGTDTQKQQDSGSLKDTGKENHDNKRMDDMDIKINPGTQTK